MIKMIDEDSNSRIEGYGYTNYVGEEETVTLNEFDTEVVYINVENTSVPLFTVDIPKLIKALEAAYKHNTTGE